MKITKKYINKQEYRDMVISSLINTDIDFDDIVIDEQIIYAGYYNVSESYYYIDGITKVTHDISIKEKDITNFNLLHINKGNSGTSGSTGSPGTSGIEYNSGTSGSSGIHIEKSYVSEKYMRKIILDYQKEIETQ